MTAITRTGLTIFATAAVLGLLGALLLQQGPFGLSGFLWIAALVGGLLLTARLAGVALAGAGRWFLLPAVLATGAAAWRATDFLIFLDFLALCIALAFAIRGARNETAFDGGLIKHALGTALAGIETLIGPFALLFSDISWKELPKGKWSDQTAAIVRGLLLAVPLLLLFGALFVAADAVFASLTDRIVSFAAGDVLEHVFQVLFWGGVAAGFFRATLLAPEPKLPDPDRPATLSFGGIEVGVILGLLNVLFLSFVLVQFRYFFGGAALVEATTGLTYAEYARRGFFELVWVGALVLPLLLGLHWLAPDGAQRLFRGLAGALVAQLFVIMASAVQRMLLYQGEYGLTELRLFATVFMGWMAVLFVWFLATVMRGRRSRFVLGAVVSGLIFLAGLHIVNPAGLIARVNLARAAEGKPFDAIYAVSLGADAAPVLIDALPRLAPADQQVIATGLLHQGNGPEAPSRTWRNWNWGMARARSLVEANREALEDWSQP